MAEYTIIVQPADNSGDHWLSCNGAAEADRFAKWVHRASGAAVAVHDFKRARERLTLGNFDESRT